MFLTTNALPLYIVMVFFNLMEADINNNTAVQCININNPHGDHYYVEHTKPKAKAALSDENIDGADGRGSSNDRQIPH